MGWTKIINTMDGWAPGARMYRRDNGEYWIVSVIDVYTVRNAVAIATGVELTPVEDLQPGLHGHVEIYRAEVQVTEQFSWKFDNEPEPPAGAELTHIIDGDTLTVYADGEPFATAHRVKTGEHYVVTPIDADGDPQNGLTPEYVLPQGTTYEQALAHIARSTTPSPASAPNPTNPSRPHRAQRSPDDPTCPRLGGNPGHDPALPKH